MDFKLAEPVYLKEMVQPTDDGIGPLTYVRSFINNVIDLTGYSPTAHAKDCTFPWCEEVHGTRLIGVAFDGARCCWCCLHRWWRRELTGGVNGGLGCVDGAPVERALLFYLQEVVLRFYIPLPDQSDHSMCYN